MNIEPIIDSNDEKRLVGFWVDSFTYGQFSSMKVRFDSIILMRMADIMGQFEKIATALYLQKLPED